MDPSGSYTLNLLLPHPKNVLDYQSGDPQPPPPPLLPPQVLFLLITKKRAGVGVSPGLKAGSCLQLTWVTQPTSRPAAEGGNEGDGGLKGFARGQSNDAQLGRCLPYMWPTNRLWIVVRSPESWSPETGQEPIPSSELGVSPGPSRVWPPNQTPSDPSIHQKEALPACLPEAWVQDPA